MELHQYIMILYDDDYYVDEDDADDNDDDEYCGWMDIWDENNLGQMMKPNQDIMIIIMVFTHLHNYKSLW